MATRVQRSRYPTTAILPTPPSPATRHRAPQRLIPYNNRSAERRHRNPTALKDIVEAAKGVLESVITTLTIAGVRLFIQFLILCPLTGDGSRTR